MRTRSSFFGFFNVLAALAIATAVGGSAGCADAQADGIADDDDLRQLQKGDIDELIVDNVPIGSAAPDGIGKVATWSVHHVQLRDPKNPALPDPVEPFNGFFVIAKDAKGTPLFFDTIALTDNAIAHFYFSFRVDDKGNYVELPIYPESNDPAELQRAERTATWLTSEKLRLGGVIRDRFASASAKGVDPQTITFEQWKAGIKCAADLAVFALTWNSPLTYYLVAQAAVDGTLAVVDALTGEDAKEDVKAALTSATIAGVFAGVTKAITKAVEKEIITPKTGDTIRNAGGKIALLRMAGVIGYQVYRNGARDGLKEAAKAFIPAACQKTYENITEVPRNDLTGGN